MPRRPHSQDSFIRLLLSYINSGNRYVRDHELPIPTIDLTRLPESPPPVIDNSNSQLDSSSALKFLKDILFDEHNMHVLESTREVFRDLFTELQHASNDASTRISNTTFKRHLRQCVEKHGSQRDVFHSNDVQITNILKNFKQAFCEIHPLPMIDQKYGILSISRAGSTKHMSHGFITFTDSTKCQSFLETFQNKLVIRGHKIVVRPAKEESLLAFYMINGKKVLKQLTNKRKHDKAVQSDADILRKKKEQRQLRRLRSKFRSKGYSDDKIRAILSKAKEKREGAERASKKRTAVHIQEGPQVKKKKIFLETSSNPPNKILLVQGLPAGFTYDEVSDLFHGEGLVEIRLVSVRNLAFVEFDTKENATKIKNKLGTTHKVGESIISVGFAK